MPLWCGINKNESIVVDGFEIPKEVGRFTYGSIKVDVSLRRNKDHCYNVRILSGPHHIQRINKNGKVQWEKLP